MDHAIIVTSYQMFFQREACGYPSRRVGSCCRRVVLIEANKESKKLSIKLLATCCYTVLWCCEGTSRSLPNLTRKVNGRLRLVKLIQPEPSSQPKGFSPHRGIAQPLKDMACRQGCQGRFVVTWRAIVPMWILEVQQGHCNARTHAHAHIYVILVVYRYTIYI